MRFIIALIAGFVVEGTFAAPRDSAAYSVMAESIDVGGTRISSSNYSIDGSLSEFGEVASAASPGTVAKSGYVGQLYEIAALQISASPPMLNEGDSGQLTGVLLLDDASIVIVPAESISWSILGGSLKSISPEGLALAGTVYQDSSATVQGAFGAVTSTLSLSILNVNNDDLPGYSGDGIADDWQVQHFGLNNPNAAPDKDPDHDGQDNNFEFTAGIDPTDATSKFNYLIEDVPGFPFRKRVVFSPRINSRDYFILTSTSLGNGSWTPLTDGLINDSGNERTVTDVNAGGSKKFYQVKIVKP